MTQIVTRLDTLPIQDWDVHDVSYKVSQICVEKNLPRYYIFYFRKGKMDGKKVIELESEEQISILGIENKEHQKILLEELKPKSGTKCVANRTINHFF